MAYVVRNCNNHVCYKQYRGDTVIFRVEFRPSPESAWYLLETIGHGEVLKTGGVFVITVEESKQSYFRPTHIVLSAGAAFPGIAVADVIKASAFSPVDVKLLVDEPIAQQHNEMPAATKVAKQGKKRQREDDSDEAECSEAVAYQREKRRKTAASSSSSSSSSSSASPPSSQHAQQQEQPQHDPVENVNVSAKGPKWQELRPVVELKVSLPTVDDSFPTQLQKLLQLDRSFKDTLIAARQVIVLSSQEITAAESVCPSVSEEYKVNAPVICHFYRSSHSPVQRKTLTGLRQQRRLIPLHPCLRASSFFHSV